MSLPWKKENFQWIWRNDHQHVTCVPTYFLTSPNCFVFFPLSENQYVLSYWCSFSCFIWGLIFYEHITSSFPSSGYALYLSTPDVLRIVTENFHLWSNSYNYLHLRIYQWLLALRVPSFSIMFIIMSCNCAKKQGYFWFSYIYIQAFTIPSPPST